MKKSYKIVIFIGIVLVVALTGFQVNKSIVANKQQAVAAKTENEYESAIKLVKDGNITESKKSFENLKGYKDSDTILQYVLALDESGKLTPNRSLINSYLDKISLDYKGTFASEIIEFRKQLNISPEDLLKQKENAIAELIKNGEYDQATLNSYADFPVLFNYANALKEEKKGNHSISLYYLSNIPKDYNGAMSTEILKLINIRSTEIQKEIERRANLPTAKASTSNTSSYTLPVSGKHPEIGMTAEEVENSSWGKPNHVNRTTTANNVSEQWVYGSGRYVYLDNGVVTAIQD